MKENEDALLLDHEVDGIQELDNKLPRWWVWLFYLTIMFSFFYLMYYHVFDTGNLSAAQYELEMERGEELKAASMERMGAELANADPSTEASILKQGEKTFITLCVPCHGPQAQGLVGPNLTDDYWIHGSEFKDTMRIITDGVPIKGMIAWKTMLPPNEIYAVASYIYTLRGTNPPNPKPPENMAGAAPAVDEESEYE